METQVKKTGFISNLRAKGKNLGVSAMAALTMLPVMIQNFLATGTENGDPSKDIFATAKDIMNTVYGDIAGIATIAAAVCGAVCLFLCIFSKNPRAVDEARSWGKRIIIAYVAIMLMGAIVTYFTVKLGLHPQGLPQ